MCYSIRCHTVPCLPIVHREPEELLDSGHGFVQGQSRWLILSYPQSPVASFDPAAVFLLKGKLKASTQGPCLT